MKLDAASNLEFGDEDALRSFFLDHSQIHQLYAQKLVATFQQQPPLFDLTDQDALEEIVRVVNGDLPMNEAVVLLAWMEKHHQLHVVESTAIGIQTETDFQTVDFGDPEQFEGWFYDHQLLHDAEDAILNP